MFRSLRLVNYRLWFAGALVSNVGFWMQRTAQDWIVLTELTNYDAAAVGLTMGLQMAPQLLLVPWSGLIADRFDRRKLLMTTNLMMAALAVGLGLIVVTGIVELWHVYAFALAGGVVSAIENPVKQAFVSDLVSEQNLANAVSLNAASFSGARMIGPAIAAALVLLVGPGWVFLINALTFAATLIALARLRLGQLVQSPRLERGRGNIRAGFRYVARQPDIQIIMVMVFLVGTFGMNFPIFAATMTTVEFGLGVGEYGVLLSCLAIGSVIGALLAARRERPQLRFVIFGAAAFGAAVALAAVMPTYWAFAAALFFAGISVQTIMSTANGVVQLGTAPAMRGRVMALYIAIFLGGTPLGAPFVGWVANHFGPRWAMGLGATSGILAALIAIVYLIRAHEVRLHYEPSARLRFVLRHNDRLTRAGAKEELALDEAVAKKV